MATTKTPAKGGRGAAKKKSTSAATKKANEAARQSKKRLYAILLFALGAMIFFLAVVPGEKLWLTLHQVLRGCFSWCSYLLGPIIIYTAVMIDLDKTNFPIAAKVTVSGVLVLLLCGAFQVFEKVLPEGGVFKIFPALYEAGVTLHGGGAAGAFFGAPLLLLLDVTGAGITIFVLIFVCLMILSGGTLVGLLKGFSRPVHKMEEAYSSAAESRAQYAQEQQKNPRPQRELTPEIFKRSKEKPEKPATAVVQQGKLLDAANAMETPIGVTPATATPATAPAPTPTVTEPNARFFDFDAHTPRAEPVQVAVTVKPENPMADDTAEMFGQVLIETDGELTIDEIISRVVVQDNVTEKVVENPIVETENGLLNFGAISEKAPAIVLPAAKSITTAATTPTITATATPTGEVLKPAYTYPPIRLLKEMKTLPKGDTTKELKANADRLVDTLKSFGVQTRIVDISRGPAVTRYELQPSAGVKISRITNLADDIALNLAAAGVRIEAPIPNKAAIGIEVPNKVVSTVPIRELLDSAAFRDAPSKLTVVLGKDITGELALADLGKMPHLLIAGATGSGKSVCINSLIMSILFKANPDEVKLLMIDPKVVELGSYNGIPHLLSPVVTDPKKAAGALCTMVGEMLRRYKLFADHNVRDLSGYNRLAAEQEELEPVPQIVIIIDELADLMMASPKDVEDYICRLAQMARAAGMHLVIATQRPSVDVITGVIKANIPSRISFAVSSQIDSRTILDMGGAEKLLGRGDMLFYPVGSSKPTRVQGCFVTDTEVESVVDFIKNGSASNYDQVLMDEIEKNAAHVGGKGGGSKSGNQTESSGAEDDDELLQAAIGVVVEAGLASTSLLQRRLKVGYARAARLVDEMEQRGIVGQFEGSKPRQVLLSKERYYEMKMNLAD